MEAQDGRFVGGQRSMDHCGSRYCTYRNVNKRLEKLDRKAKRTIQLCLLDSVLLNVSREATTKALWNKLGVLYQSKSLVKQIVSMEEVVQPEDERWRLGDRASKCLQYYGK
jgi:hypothetical protein